MITSKFIDKQRLGNQLFIYASLLGIATRNNTAVNKVPNFTFNMKNISTLEFWDRDKPIVSYKEKSFLYNDINLPSNEADYDLEGYYQSYKYWEGLVDIKKLFKFKDDLVIQAEKILNILPCKKKICIHIRRGDYVGNPNYVNLPITYYIKALLDNFPNYEDYNILVFSDDIEYCKIHFSCLNNVFFLQGNTDIQDLILATLCDHFILSNSTYSWWMAYLGEKEYSKVIRPKGYFAGKLAETCNTNDFWKENWIEYDDTDTALDLTDCTFTIPVQYDHSDRIQNLDLVVDNLQKNFDTNIFVGENVISHLKFSEISKKTKYKTFFEKVFHRTKMLNVLAKDSETDIIVNYDADVFIPPLQMYLAVKAIRLGADMVYPYDGRFNRMPRSEWYHILQRYSDIGFVRDVIFNGSRPNDNHNSVGGCIVFNKKSFIKGGMENEEFISFGDEDNERFFRFKLLEFNVLKIKGCLYHLDHFVGIDSSVKNPYFKQNKQLWLKIKEMNKEELINYIKNTFTWKI